MTTEASRPLPIADGESGLSILKELIRDRSLLTALTLMYRYVGKAFRITLPRFQPAVFIGPESNRQILVSERHKLRWRTESDPVAKLLGRGVLVVDDEEHDHLRGLMDPPLQRRHVLPQIDRMWQYSDQVLDTWEDGGARDMLVEMRRLALLTLTGCLFRVDFAPDLDRLWRPILRLLEYISPGPWIFWAGMPRPKYRSARRQMDAYLYGLIRQRRTDLAAGRITAEAGDLLSQLVLSPDLDDRRIRDQLLTMLIAGHDTSTAQLSWTLYLLGAHPEELARVRAEVDAVLGDADRPPTVEELNRLHVIEQVVKETLRMYPPIHVGNRCAREDMTICGYHVPQGTRVMYSIYLSHRDTDYWQDPEQFCPARFDHQHEVSDGDQPVRPPFAYVPFGGGPRNCIGASFAQIEAKVVLARIFQRFDLELVNGAEVRPYMGATLEPRPGVIMRIHRRS